MRTNDDCEVAMKGKYVCSVCGLYKENALSLKQHQAITGHCRKNGK